MKQFFESKALMMVVDRMARRYGVLPHVILTTLSMEEFNLDVAIMVQNEIWEAQANQKAQENANSEALPTETKWSAFGIERQVIKAGVDK